MVNEEIVESKDEMKKKMEKMKEEASKKKEKIKETTGKVKEDISKKKEDVSENIEEIKEEASKKKEKIKETTGEIKKEAVEQKNKLEEESEAEGMTPPEKLLNDIVKGFQQRTGEINETIADYAKEYKGSKIKKPLIDVLETNETIIIIADLPKVKKEDLDIGISRNIVEIATKFKENVDIEGAKFIQKERSYGETKRSINLSSDIKIKEVSAKLKDCTLTITLPKAEKDVAKVQIE
jgi:HSP20 family protein